MRADDQDDSSLATARTKGVSRLETTELNDEDDNEGEEIGQVMQRMEDELNEAGALDLDPTPRKIAATLTAAKAMDTRDGVAKPPPVSEESSDPDVNIDFGLVKNLLDSYKGQAGMAGPGGNLLGLMGIQLPADADDTLP